MEVNLHIKVAMDLYFFMTDWKYKQQSLNERWIDTSISRYEITEITIYFHDEITEMVVKHFAHRCLVLTHKSVEVNNWILNSSPQNSVQTTS